MKFSTAENKASELTRRSKCDFLQRSHRVWWHKELTANGVTYRTTPGISSSPRGASVPPVRCYARTSAARRRTRWHPEAAPGSRPIRKQGRPSPAPPHAASQRTGRRSSALSRRFRTRCGRLGSCCRIPFSRGAQTQARRDAHDRGVTFELDTDYFRCNHENKITFLISRKLKTCIINNNNNRLDLDSTFLGTQSALYWTHFSFTTHLLWW